MNLSQTPTSSPAIPPQSFSRKLTLFAGDIKISHSIFAMPWALLAMFLAAGGWPRAGQVALIILSMVFARTVAMAANRLLDAKLDAQNPRTSRRAIPSGALSQGFVVYTMSICALLFIAGTSLFGVWYHNWLPLIFAVPVLIFISAYPLLKRFSQLCHYYLGAALALAPVCAWIAIAGNIAHPPLLMAGAVLLWTAGFDIIYACLDYQSDLQTGIISVPVRFGIAGALRISRLTHGACVILMILLGVLTPALQSFYIAGVAIAAMLLIIEHMLVRPGDFSKVGLAFFTINGIISVVIGTLGILDVFF